MKCGYGALWFRVLWSLTVFGLSGCGAGLLDLEPENGPYGLSSQVLLEGAWQSNCNRPSDGDLSPLLTDRLPYNLAVKFVGSKAIRTVVLHQGPGCTSPILMVKVEYDVVVSSPSDDPTFGYIDFLNGRGTLSILSMEGLDVLNAWGGCYTPERSVPGEEALVFKGTGSSCRIPVHEDYHDIFEISDSDSTLRLGPFGAAPTPRPASYDTQMSFRRSPK